MPPQTASASPRRYEWLMHNSACWVQETGSHCIICRKILSHTEMDSVWSCRPKQQSSYASPRLLDEQFLKLVSTPGHFKFKLLKTTLKVTHSLEQFWVL